MYKLVGPYLRTVKDLTENVDNRILLSQCRLIIFQHLFEDTLEFIGHLMEAGVKIECVIGKEYSIDKQVIHQLEDIGLKVYSIHYAELENTSFLLNVLLHAIEKAKDRNEKVIIHEVGGYFSEAIQQIPVHLSDHFLGVVEDTTFGFNKYKCIESHLKVPVLHVARSPLKEIEAVFVGEAIVLAFNNILRSLGVSIPGREALVIGFGMIGKNVAKLLKANGIHVTVYDIDDLRLLSAFIEGYKFERSLDDSVLSKFDLVFSATGKRAVSFEKIKKMKSGVILVSGGSRDTEFDMISLKTCAYAKVELTAEVATYTIHDGSQSKEITVLRNGTAINFREKSVPSEIIDIVFSEIIECFVALMKTPDKFKPGLHQLSYDYLTRIAGKWLVNMQLGMHRELTLNEIEV